MAALATCTGAGVASMASAQCSSYIVAPGTATFVSGTTDIGNHNDDVSTTIALPFPITIYGTTTSSAAACSNGFLNFGTASTAFTNACPLLATSFTGPTICPHWDDLRTDGTGNGIFTAILGTAPTRTFVIEWRAGFFSACTGTANFEILLHEGSSDFDTIIANGGSCNGSSATNGVTSGVTGGSVTQFSCNTGGLIPGLSLHYTCVTPTNGACCAQDGTCSVIISTACAAPSIFSGTGTTCSGAGSTCPSPVGACCTSCGACTFVSGAAACAAGNTYSGNGTACSPNTCASGGPTNDVCASATPLTLGATASGTTACAGNDVSPCASMGKTVWYSFTPAASGLFDVSLCGSNFDTALATYASCAAATSIACNDDSCGLQSQLIGQEFDAPNTYFIVLGGFGGASGNYSIVVSASTTAGNCCDTSTAACTIVTASTACASPSVFTAGAVCTPNPCSTANGACCNPDGTCTVGSGANCSGLFQGPNTACSGANNTCPSTSVGSCCSTTAGTCAYVASSTACAAPSVFNLGGLCTPNTCPAVGACCTPCCAVTLQANCTGTWTANTTCTTAPCAPPVNDTCAGAIALTLGTSASGNNCTATDDADLPSCTFGAPANSHKGVYYSFTPASSGLFEVDTCGSAMPDTILAVYSGACGALTELASNDDSTNTTCPVGNMACSSNGLNSRIPSVALTAGTTYFVQVSSYGSGTATGGAYNVVVNAAGACCVGAVCSLSTSAGCSGSFAANVSCTPNICVGVCCRGSTCNTTVPFANCTGSGTAGAVFATGALVCNGTGNATSPCCYADYDHNGSIAVTDIFSFLADWFAGNPFANVGGDGSPAALSIQNIFDFLTDWFAGGC